MPADAGRAANERRIIHIALAEDRVVTTESVGEGDERRASVTLRRGARAGCRWTTPEFARCYDIRGRVIRQHREIDSNPYDTLLAYDALEQVVDLTYPDGEIARHYRNPADGSLVGMCATLSEVKYWPYGAIRSGGITHTDALHGAAGGRVATGNAARRRGEAALDLLWTLVYFFGRIAAGKLWYPIWHPFGPTSSYWGTVYGY